MRSLLFILPAFALACATSGQWESIDIARTPGAKEHPDADAVVLIDRLRLEFHLVDGKPVADSHIRMRVRVLTEEGRAQAALHASYDNAFSQILNARARRIRPDGTVEEFGRDKMTDVMAVPGGILYDDSRLLYLLQETAPIGSVIEYEYTRRETQPNLFQFNWYFGMSVPVETAEFVVEAPADWEIEHVATQYWQPFDFAPVVEEENGLRRLIWKKGSIPALKEEDLSPERRNRAICVSARLKSWMNGKDKNSSFATIREFSKYMHDLQQGTAEPTPEIARTVDEVLRGAPDDPKEKARRLYDWVQTNIRYVAVEVGIGGWKPHAAKEIFETKYGDCKDKATLLKSFLQVAGIESHLATLFSHDGYPRRMLLPAFGNTNHAILVIELPNEQVIVDPTERTVPFGALPLRDQEAELLMIKAEGAEPILTPATDARFNTKRSELELVIDQNGDAKGTFSLHTKGDFAWTLKQDMMAQSDGQQREMALGWLWLRTGVVDLVRHDPGSAIDPTRMEVSALGELSVAQLVSSSASARVLRMSELFHTPGDALHDEERTSPIVFRRRERRELSLLVRIPEQSRWSSLPAPVKIESPFGWYSLEYRQEGDALRVDSVFEQSERIVPPERYSELRKFFDEIMAATSRAVVIKAK